MYEADRNIIQIFTNLRVNISVSLYFPFKVFFIFKGS